jgi:transposase-like protein
VKHATRPAIFKWRQTAPELILCAVRWYLRYSLSLRDVEELFAERGLEADHDDLALGSTIRSRTGNATAPSS